MSARREVGPVRQQLKTAGRRLAERLAPTVMASISDVPRLRAEVRQAQQRATKATQQTRALRNRVERLEAEIQEARRLNRHVAEVTDIVQEVLLPAADRDDERLKEVLTRYKDSF